MNLVVFPRVKPLSHTSPTLGKHARILNSLKVTFSVFD